MRMAKLVKIITKKLSIPIIYEMLKKIVINLNSLKLIDLGFIEETDSKIIFHARSIHDSFPQETKVSDEKQTEKMERFPQETNNFPQETNNFPQETIVSHSTEEIDNNNNNNKIDSSEPTIILSERLEKLAQQFTFAGARFNSTVIEQRGKRRRLDCGGKLNINKPIKRELSVCSLLRNSHLKKVKS